jgi:hypothetical protein
MLELAKMGVMMIAAKYQVDRRVKLVLDTGK